MLTASYVLNLLILGPLIAAFVWRAEHIDPIFGPATDARQILFCLYATLALASLVGLVMLARGQMAAALNLGIALFSIQIAYKLMTLPLVGWDSPVVKTNMMVVLFHTATLVAVWRSA